MKMHFIFLVIFLSRREDFLFGCLHAFCLIRYSISVKIQEKQLERQLLKQCERVTLARDLNLQPIWITSPVLYH